MVRASSCAAAGPGARRCYERRTGCAARVLSSRVRLVAKIDEGNEQDLEDKRAESAKEAIQGNFGELNDRTTALCCSAQVRGAPITLVVDTGASGSVAGKQFLDDH